MTIARPWAGQSDEMMMLFVHGVTGMDQPHRCTVRVQCGMAPVFLQRAEMSNQVIVIEPIVEVDRAREHNGILSVTGGNEKHDATAPKYQ